MLQGSGIRRKKYVGVNEKGIQEMVRLNRIIMKDRMEYLEDEENRKCRETEWGLVLGAEGTRGIDNVNKERLQRCCCKRWRWGV